MRLPDFLIIGAAKSGTTSLYVYLDKHPQVYMSPVKEPQFFAVDKKYEQGIEWYASLFQAAHPHQLCGEASTDYAKYPQYPETPARIAQTIPQVKMIYIMRHPVERSYAYYVHLRRHGKFEDTFEEEIANSNVCLDGSNYIMQIEHYLKFFPKESFLFLLMEDLIEKPAEVLNQIYDFLGIEQRIDLTQNEEIKANSFKTFFQDVIREKITKPLKAIPGVSPLANRLPKKWRGWVYNNIIEKSYYGKEIKKQYLPQPMLPETRQMLIEKFRESNNRLAEFLGRDLSCWDK
ncbi:MAG: sulfotransferase domain-containing protein [Gomphosphaeria aponina SAG 52.96 = DSM 107014]|uniref:Sulfotransferase domain-containing protein n=1 Tax=Gomphosphaeria aponina SAG 52.96 = DSM 107014 TaxID=1521640 RepID=A0A941GS27_9CHRO|nr:sulfotransferase domain-containing protein [Gomphosphaeria aponina SAG 52.96 = DSM 107014]